MDEHASLVELQKAGRRRLYPRLTDPNWPVLRRRRQIFQDWTRRLNWESARVLDVGGRLQPYRELLRFKHQYWALDLRRTALVNVMARAEQLPFADESFDLVLCTQMLEYVTDPCLVAQEIHRVLRPRGVLFLSAPSFCPIDSEQDRWRFYAAGLRELFGRFSELEVIPECGSVVGFLRTTGLFLYFSARYESLRSAMRWTVCPLLNSFAAVMQLADGNRDGAFTPNYSVRAVK